MVLFQEPCVRPSHVRTSGFRLGIRGRDEGRGDETTAGGEWEEPEVAIAARVEGEEKGRDCGGEREKDGMGIMYMGYAAGLVAVGSSTWLK